MYSDYTGFSFTANGPDITPETDEEYEKHVDFAKELNHSDFRILERLAELEEIIIQQGNRIKELEAKNNDKPIYIKSTIEARANELLSKLYTQPRRYGYIYLDSVEARRYLESEVREDLRFGNIQNTRDMTIKTMKKMILLFPNEVILEKSSFKHRKLIIRLKI